MPLSFPNWKFPVLNYLLGTSKKSNEGIKKEGRSSSPAPTLSSSGSSNTLTSSSSDPDLSRHSITVEEPHRESSATAMRPSSPSLWEDAPPDFTRSTISIHQGRETFTLPHDPHSWYVHDPRRSTVTRYDKIDDGYGFKGEEIPENKFREKIITAVPLNDSSYRSSLSSRTSTRSQSPKIAVPSKKITLAEEGKARAREIVETEINSLSEEDHQKIRELVKPGTRLHVARFYLMGNFLEKLETEEMKKKVS